MMRKDLFLVKEFSSLLDFMLKSCLFLHTEKDITRLLDQKRILVNDELVSDFVNLKPGDKLVLLSPQYLEPSVNTDFKILENIEIYGYFDIYIEQEIENILNSQSHEVIQKLTTFIQKRADLIKKITILKQALEDLGIKENTKDGEIYQIAFSFPFQAPPQEIPAHQKVYL